MPSTCSAWADLSESDRRVIGHLWSLIQEAEFEQARGERDQAIQALQQDRTEVHRLARSNDAARKARAKVMLQTQAAAAGEQDLMEILSAAVVAARAELEARLQRVRQLERDLADCESRLLALQPTPGATIRELHRVDQGKQAQPRPTSFAWTT